MPDNTREETDSPYKQPEAWEDCIKDSSIQVEDTLTFPNQDWQTLISNLTPRIQKLLTYQRASDVRRLEEGIKNLTPFSIGVQQDPLISKDAVLALLKNNK